MSSTQTPPPAHPAQGGAGGNSPSGSESGPAWRRILFGPPISTTEADHTKLPKRVALPVFASDAISSVAYATQEILLALGLSGLAVATAASQYEKYLASITAAIVVLLVIVVFSYSQTIFAYPKGGGSYIVTKSNLGMFPGLIAGAALLIDYVLTVAVSVASGTQNLLATPLFSHLPLWVGPELVCLIFIVILTFANLRGLKESGVLFALPTYLFIVMTLLMVGLGLFGEHLGWVVHREAVNQTLPEGYPGLTASPAIGLVGVLVGLRAFANGCSAMTGTEAISDGVPAFQVPESKNAAKTLTWMAIILGTLFVGTSALAIKFHVVYYEYQHGAQVAPAVIDQFSSAVFGKTGTFSWLYYTMQFATAAILVLAANTAFADFPRLASFLANDRFLPRELAHRGDRLVFSRGIVMLGFFAALLTIIFRGSVDRLIPLYALGVFTAFTLSQISMVRRWFTEKGPGWGFKAAVNGIGAIATAIVFSVILYEKAPEGAWIVIVVEGILIVIFRAIHDRYVARARGLTLGDPVPGGIDLDSPEHGGNKVKGGPQSTHAGAGSVGAAEPDGLFVAPGSSIIRNMPDAPRRNTVLVLVPGIHKGVLPALNYARLLAPTFRAVYIEIDPDHTPQVEASWNRHVPDVPLVVVPSPYRSLVQPLLDYIDKVTDEYEDDVVTLVIPEAFSGNLLDTLLRSTAAAQLKLALLGREDVVVVNVRYRLVK